MAEITAATVKELRERTGAGMMDCKKALAENNGEMEASIDWLRAKGLAAAAKKAGRTAAEGLVGLAVEANRGAVVEVNSETDFVALESAAPAETLSQLGKQIAMHVAAAHPLALTADHLDSALVERERAVAMEKARESGKPQNIIEKMVEGGLAKFRKENALLSQLFVMDNKTPVAEVVASAAKEAGAGIQLIGFVRYQLGEGIEKKQEDFAAEVAAAAGRS